MVYDWAGKEHECFRWYVVERKSLDELMRHMKASYGFEPSKRAYQTQFKRWNFPSKQSPNYHDARLLERIRQLWESNHGQKDMLLTLSTEGWDLKNRELMRLRSKHGLLLRGANGIDTVKENRRDDPPRVNSAFESDACDVSDSGPFGESYGNSDNDAEAHSPMGRDQLSVSWSRSPRQMQEKSSARLQTRLADLQQQSEELRATKKRRRRTHSYAGLPADPPGPPRFPSETTLDESKAFLHLSNGSYQSVRDDFVRICSEENIVKKSISGPEKWQAAKDRLVIENTDLQKQLHGPDDGISLAQKTLAVDVICMDVTKRLRHQETRMTISEAKKVLSLNPYNSRKIRHEFYAILHADHFVSKLQTGPDHFDQLKRGWLESSSLVQSVLNSEGGPASDSHYERKMKALDVLSRDVMKRIRDDITRADPSQKRQGALGPGPGPARPRQPPTLHQNVVDGWPEDMPLLTQFSRPLRSGRGLMQRNLVNGSTSDSAQHSHIDPSLANRTDPSVTVEGLGRTSAVNKHLDQPLLTLSHPVAALFRLHSASPVQTTQKLWFGTITSTGFDDLVASASATHTSASQSSSELLMVTKIEGLLPSQSGSEMPFQIEHDDEVAAFLEFVGGGRLVFQITIASIHA